MTFEPPDGWAQPPPSPLLELLDRFEALEASWANCASFATDDTIIPLRVANAHHRAWQEAARQLREALTEEYAP